MYEQDHLLFQESVRRFTEREITPHVDRWEAEENFPSEIFEKLGEQGFLGILVDEEYGGVNGGYLLAGAWCEQFGRIPAVGFTTGVNMHSLVVASALNRLGSPEAKERWLRAAVQGKAIGAYAFTEPGAGSDLTVVRTKAVRDGDGYRLTGSKIFITNGARAHFVLVLAKTDQDAGYDGFTTFVVDTSREGFSVSRKLEKLGWHSSDTAELSFTDVRLEKTDVLGVEGKGWHQAMESLQWERLMLALGALGGASACLDKTIPYINDRKIFNRAISTFDHNRELLAGLSAKLAAGRALCHHSLRLLQAGERCRKESSLAKLYVCELAIKIADRCLQLHGGYGYTKEYIPERWLRDLRLNTIGGGTSEVMARIAAKEIFTGE